MFTTLRVSPVSCMTIVHNDANSSIGVCKVSALYLFTGTRFCPQVIESIVIRSSKDDYKFLQLPPCPFSLVSLTLFPLEIWVGIGNLF